MERTRTADEIFEQRKADRLIRLMDLREDIAHHAETAPDGMLRGAFAKRYRELVGVRPDQRNELRRCLADLQGFTVGELLGTFTRS